MALIEIIKDGTTYIPTGLWELISGEEVGKPGTVFLRRMPDIPPSLSPASPAVGEPYPGRLLWPA